MSSVATQSFTRPCDPCCSTLLVSSTLYPSANCSFPVLVLVYVYIYIYIYIYIYQYILDWNSKIVWKFSKLDCLVVKAFEEETYLIPIFEESFKISLKHEIKPYVNYIIHPSNVQLRLSIAYFNSRRNYVITAWHDKRIRRMIGNGRVQFVFLTHSLCPFQTTVCNISLIINYWDIFSLWTVNSGNIYQFCLPIFFF